MKKKINIVLLFILFVIVSFFTIYVHVQKSNINTMPSIGEICKMLDGTWLKKFSECENIPKERCELQNGTFQECESACRHKKKDSICTEQCIAVCTFQLE